MKIYNVYKKLGQTPLQALQVLRKQKQILHKNLSYAGRLDPMAEGVLLVLQNATLAQREKYLALSKIYEAEIVFGFSTDSFDVLGMPRKQKEKVSSNKEIEQILEKYKGKVKLTVPVYSSIQVKGKALHEWARMENLANINIPKKEMKIISIQGLKYGRYTNKQLIKKLSDKISKVHGDFRQEKILKAWKKLLIKSRYYQSVHFKIKCSSGTYIRSIADDLGKQLKTGAVLFNLKRTAVGKYRI